MPAEFPWQAMRDRPPGLWRYREALPIAVQTTPVSLGEPQTPLSYVDMPSGQLILKLDHLFPTGSFKDRGATVLLTKAVELGVTSVVEDSSGNAGAAIAAYAAAAGIAARIYVPASASPAKTSQITLYGAGLVRVPGTRAATAQAAWQEAQRTYYASHVWNPYFLEGTKTIAFELWEQLGCRAPDWIIVPVGHGTMLLGVFKGFEHLRQAGLIRILPRIVGVQAAACAPIYRAWLSGLNDLPQTLAVVTQAEGIAISQPVRWRQIVQAVRQSDGFLVTASEEAIESALLAWARRGQLVEPTSAVTLAAYEQMASAGRFASHDLVVAPLTGTGTKAAAYLAGKFSSLPGSMA